MSAEILQEGRVIGRITNAGEVIPGVIQRVNPYYPSTDALMTNGIIVGGVSRFDLQLSLGGEFDEVLRAAVEKEALGI